MVLVRIVKIRIALAIKDRVSVKGVRVRVRLRVSVSRVRRSMGMENSAVVYICQSRPESNTKCLVLGFRVFYSVLL